MSLLSKTAWITICSLSMTLTSFAQTPQESGDEQPPPVANSVRKNLKLDIGCKREFSHDGQYYRLDSFDSKDGERLRPFIQEYPDAITQLDLYQKNSNNLTKAATIGTLGLIAIILANNLLSDRNIGQTGRDVARYGGGGLLVGAAIFSFLTIRTNEGHLNQAVEMHNQHAPNSPIELKFNSGFVF
ncbi:MAG: hypothetical protein KA715_03975 [Xanthomonadaceae bacterium]|nr:hypothetical protein [Xanthomonadaceae bacterium]